MLDLKMSGFGSPADGVGEILEFAPEHQAWAFIESYRREELVRAD